jgi:hypothetical protein
MQFKYIITGVLIVILSSAACTKKNLFDQPLDAVSTATAFSSPERIDKASTGMYSALQNINWGCGRNFIYTDVQGLDANPSSFFGNIGFFNQMRPEDGTITSAWIAAYTTIYTANLFVKNFMPVMNTVTPEKANQYLGEAKFIRAYNYFYLVNLWAQPYTDPINGAAKNLGVPLILEAAEDPFSSTTQIPRSTVKEVYDQIEKDLLDAETKLPLSYTGDAYTNVARATKGAARGLLMRMYLYEGNWAKAVNYADAIINENLYGLNAAPEIPFRNYTTKESIFSVAFSGSNNPDRNNALAAHYSPSVRGDISISNAYLNLMDTLNDLRYKNLVIKTIKGTGTAATQYFWTIKYTNFADWVPVLRYPEVLLVKAEALARQGAAGDPANVTALTLLNQVRTRSKASPITVTTNQQLISAILTERRIELAFEGQSFFDLQRTQQDIPAHASIQIPQPYGSTYRVLPIPQRDINIMPTLEQNKGY